MSPPSSEAITIPARITAEEFAKAIGRDFREVQAVLSARQEPDSPEDVLSADIATAAAKALGVEVAIESRDLALEHLYTYESTGDLAEDLDGRAGRLARGVISHLDDLDAKIEAASEHWSVARMPVIDRNILRIGLFELENDPGTPTAVIVAEAVRMAQTYSTDRSASFVNGVLAALSTTSRQ